MGKKYNEYTKNIIMSIARKMYSERMIALLYRIKFEEWKSRHSRECPVFDKRFSMYNYINNELIRKKELQYIEFGVHKGDSIKYFSEINVNVNSRFIGFDTFTGLPEDWRDVGGIVRQKKAFDTKGEIPRINDMRVSFKKGLFQDTLPIFLGEYTGRGQLVINIDSDLYSSAMYVLTCANTIVCPNAIIIFDEFFSAINEFKALDDYCISYMRNYEVVASTSNFGQIAIRMI